MRVPGVSGSPSGALVARTVSVPRQIWGFTRIGGAMPVADHQTMSNVTRDNPPFLPTPTADQTPAGRADHHPLILVVISVAFGLAAAVPIGSLLGWLIYSGFAADCHNDGWCELGAAIYGLLGGFAAATVAHVVAGVAFIRHHWPTGQRTRPVAMHLGLSVVVIGLLLAVVGI